MTSEGWKEEGGAGCKEDAPVQGRSFQRPKARLGVGQGPGGLSVRSPDVYGGLLRGTDTSYNQDYGCQLYLRTDFDRLCLCSSSNGARATEGTSFTDDDNNSHQWRARTPTAACIHLPNDGIVTTQRQRVYGGFTTAADTPALLSRR